MDKIEKIYNYIEEMYGSRKVWISDISHKLRISKYKVNILTSAAGYKRGKRNQVVDLSDYKNNIVVVTLVKEIKESLLNNL